MRPAAGRHGRPSEIPAKANVTAAQPQRGVSKRAVFVGLLCATAISCGESYGTLVVSGSAMAADYSTGAAIFLFFLLTLLLNPLAHLLTGSRLHSGELATIYIMMIVASAIPSWGFVMNLIPFLGGLFYFATPENDWANIIHPHIKPWLVSQDRAAIWKLFEGAARGEPVPWGLWHKPMLAWGFFILSVYLVTLCMLVILRKQWMEHERLLFPLSVLPLELAQGEQGRLLPPLLRNYLTWVGFLLPFLINLVNGLHSYFNYFPFIQLNTPLRFLRESVRMNLYPRFEVIGLSYLLSLDVSFGVWFFAFLAYVHTGVERLFGWSIGPSQPYSMPASASVAHLAQGAMFFLVFSSLWAARQHIGDVLRKPSSAIRRLTIAARCSRTARPYWVLSSGRSSPCGGWRKPACSSALRFFTFCSAWPLLSVWRVLSPKPASPAVCRRWPRRYLWSRRLGRPRLERAG